MREKDWGRLEATVEHLAQAVNKLEEAIKLILDSNATKKDLKDAIEGLRGRYWLMEKLVYGGVGVIVYSLLEKLISKITV